LLGEGFFAELGVLERHRSYTMGLGRSRPHTDGVASPLGSSTIGALVF
jgi:hypothetical protein